MELDFISHSIMDGETQVYGYDPETKLQLSHNDSHLLHLAQRKSKKSLIRFENNVDRFF